MADHLPLENVISDAVRRTVLDVLEVREGDLHGAQLMAAVAAKPLLTLPTT